MKWAIRSRAGRYYVKHACVSGCWVAAWSNSPAGAHLYCEASHASSALRRMLSDVSGVQDLEHVLFGDRLTVVPVLVEANHGSH